MFKKVVLLVLTAKLSCANIQAQNLDINLLRQINSHESPYKNNLTTFAANSATPMSIAVPVLIYGYHAFKYKNYAHNKSLVISASLISASLLTTSLKYSINRERPYITYPDLTKRSSGGSPSFPSGHTSTAFALATSVTIAYPKWYIAVPAYIWAGGVGYSRMYQGVHYPSDVLVGALVGAGTSWLCYVINKKYIRQQKTGKH